MIAELWRQEAETASGIADLEAAGAFRRISGANDGRLPDEFCLALTADRVVALGFDPVNQQHPVAVEGSQFGARIAEWPRRSVRVGAQASAGEKGSLAIETDEETIACRAIDPNRNPASLRVAALLGLELPRT